MKDDKICQEMVEKKMKRWNINPCEEIKKIMCVFEKENKLGKKKAQNMSKMCLGEMHLCATRCKGVKI